MEKKDKDRRLRSDLLVKHWQAEGLDRREPVATLDRESFRRYIPEIKHIQGYRKYYERFIATRGYLSKFLGR